MRYFILDLNLVIFIILFIILSGVLCIHDYLRHAKRTSLRRIILLICLSFYAVLFIKFVILPVWIFFDTSMLEELPLTLSNFIQYVPFKSIIATIKAGTWPIQIFGNIIMLMPVPVFLELFRNKKYSLKHMLWLGLLMSLGVELLQGIIIFLTGYPSKVIDIDDIILNILGVLLVYFIVKALNKMKLYQKFIQPGNEK